MSDQAYVSPLSRARQWQDAWQIRVEQRVQIRVIPRASAPVPMSAPRDVIKRQQQRILDPRGVNPQETSRRAIDPEDMRERKIGKCVPISGIAGVQPDRANRLLLIMRDRRLLSAEVERSCRSRDFYSGFYLSRTPDGQICVDRDELLSRSGMSCRLTRIRQLVEEER